MICNSHRPLLYSQLNIVNIIYVLNFLITPLKEYFLFYGSNHKKRTGATKDNESMASLGSGTLSYIIVYKHNSASYLNHRVKALSCKITPSKNKSNCEILFGNYSRHTLFTKDKKGTIQPL